MLCPPVPWTSIQRGGFLLTQTPFLRTKVVDPSQILDALNETPITELYPAFDNLNQASTVPWKINSRLLDVAVALFDENFTGNKKLSDTQQNF